MFLDFFARGSNVWSPAQHEFVGHDAKCEVVDCERMAFSQHDLRSHIPWGSTGVLVVVLSHHSRDAEVSEPQVAIGVEDQILWLEIAMDNAMAVEVLQGEDDAGEEEFAFSLAEELAVADVVS